MKTNYKKFVFTVIGIGKVGSALCFELKEAGFDVRYIIDKNKKRLKYVSSKTRIRNASAVIEKHFLTNSDIIIISVQDKYLCKVISDIRKMNLNLRNKILFHTSGFSDSGIFKSLDISPFRIGSFHPLQTFNIVSFRNNYLLRNIYFGIEGKKYAKELLIYIAGKLGSDYIILNNKKKPLYHLACVLASNFLVTYLNLLSQIINKLKLKSPDDIKIFHPIINETLCNIKKYGLEKSLTGPYVRGDIDVISGHVSSIKNDFPELLPFYKLLGNKTLEIAVKKTKLTVKDKRTLKKLLE